MFQESHADEETIMRLSEIDGARRGIDFWQDLIDTWERVHDDGSLLHLIGEFPVDLIAAFEFPILLITLEAFFLDTSLIEDVDFFFDGI